MRLFLKIYPFILFSLCLLSSCREKNVYGCMQYVDPFIGTAYTGHTFPSASYPFGLVQPGPQTGNFGWDYCSGYNYEDSLIWGFTQTRLNGTGIPDLGDILMMPYSGTPGSDYQSSFLKKSEIAYPGYYGVELIDNSVEVELTCTPHVAMHRYRYRKENPAVYVDFQSGNVSSKDQYLSRVLDVKINKEDEYTITGYLHVTHWVERELFFVIQFDQPIISEEKIDAHKAPAYVYYFKGDKNKEVKVKVAISTVSVDGAKKNLNKELNHWNFDQVKKETGEKWESYLSRVEIKGSPEQKKNFYTSLYHLLIQPNNIADIDGMYRGPDGKTYLASINKYYSTFSLWDTYRAAHPLYTLIAPEHVSEMINSMLMHAGKQGFLPIWTLWGKESYCMIGNHGVPPIVEACLKDFPSINQEEAYLWIKQSLTTSHVNSNWEIYDHYGYYPFDLVPEESVSRTLESNYDDYCAALLAKKLNKQDDYEFFMKRSNYWKNLFDPESKLARGKDSAGNWRIPFDRFALSHAGTAGGDYTEGNAWQYTWHVQQDVKGLIDMFGGNDTFTAKLDSLFVLDTTAEVKGFVGDVTGLIGQYAQGNEPSHHVIYLYALAGKKYRTEELIREVFDKFYQPRPDGLCGNDDCGQMSAWYIFSAMGFYPVNPVSGQYVLGAPQLPEIKIILPNKKTFTITANKLSKENKYVESVKLNGKDIVNPFITYEQILNGGTLFFNMTDKITRK